MRTLNYNCCVNHILWLKFHQTYLINITDCRDFIIRTVTFSYLNYILMYQTSNGYFYQVESLSTDVLYQLLLL